MEEISYTLIYRKRFYILTVVFFHLVTFPRVSCPPLSFTCLEFSLAVIYFCICGALKCTAFLHSLPFFCFTIFSPLGFQKKGMRTPQKVKWVLIFFASTFLQGQQRTAFLFVFFLSGCFQSSVCFRFSNRK